MELAVLSAIIALPIILTFLLKSNPRLGFLSLCVGALLQFYAGSEVIKNLDDNSVNFASDSSVMIAIALAPYVLTLIFTRGSLKKLSKAIVQVIPIVATGLLMACIIVPYLASPLGSDISSLKIWVELDKYKGAVVAIGALTSLAGYWMSASKTRKHDKKHKK
jgi:hypothetical protein